MSTNDSLDRRDFLKSVGATGLTLTAATSAIGRQDRQQDERRPRDRRQRPHQCRRHRLRRPRAATMPTRSPRFASKHNNACQIVAACDVYEKRKKKVAEKYKVKGYLDYRELLNQSDVDAVVIATPDHWHGKMAMDAMDKGKDVYLEKPMVHTNEEARQLVATVKETKRILQVGSQTTSADIWWKAKKAIADGMIGQMIDEPGLLPPQQRRGRVELAHRCRTPARTARATTTSTGTCGWAPSSSSPPSAPGMPTASSASASIGIIRWASPATCSIT